MSTRRRSGRRGHDGLQGQPRDPEGDPAAGRDSELRQPFLSGCRRSVMKERFRRAGLFVAVIATAGTGSVAAAQPQLKPAMESVTATAHTQPTRMSDPDISDAYIYLLG